jgi:HK97 family phage portal protein
VSILRQLTKQRTFEETFNNYSTLWRGGMSRTGVNVSRESAMRHAAVWACVRLRGETVGALPVDVVEYHGTTREQVEHPPWLQRPNPETTRFELMERTTASIDTDGNAFWYFERDRLKRVQEVWPLPPSGVQVYRDPPNPQQPNKPRPKLFRVDNDEYTSDDILHIPGFTLPGRLRGLSPIEQHASSIGLALAAEEYGESFFRNGATMSGVIEAERDPGEDAVRRMRASFARDHQGLRNSHKPGFLFGAKWTPLSIPNDAAQFLETRKYQLGEIARIFRVPPHKIGDLDRATFSNIEHQAIEWVTDGVIPTTARIEAAVLAAGILDVGQHLRFNFSGLLRGDTVSRYAAYAVGRQWGWLSVDDIRALEDQNPLPDGRGQVYLEPMNMTPVGQEDELKIPEQVSAAAALVAAGYDPAAALTVVGLDPIRHLGALTPARTEG